VMVYVAIAKVEGAEVEIAEDRCGAYFENYARGAAYSRGAKGCLTSDRVRRGEDLLGLSVLPRPFVEVQPRAFDGIAIMFSRSIAQREQSSRGGWPAIFSDGQIPLSTILTLALLDQMLSVLIILKETVRWHTTAHRSLHW
jgi:hypothetical protein